MIIEQTMEIPSNRSITIALPRSVPAGAMARVSITIPTAFDGQSSTHPAQSDTVKSLRGILKGRGITLERFREMQREDKALEEASE
jgi:hypothetical protein